MILWHQLLLYLIRKNSLNIICVFCFYFSFILEVGEHHPLQIKTPYWADISDIDI